MQYQRLTARQLGAINDSACSLILDPYVGVNSRKIFHRPPVKNQSKLKHIVQRLVDGKVNEDGALELLLARGETQRKVRQLTTYLALSQDQIGQHFKLYLAAFRSAQNFKLELCDHYISACPDGKPGLRVVATRSFSENDIIPALVGVVASTNTVSPTTDSKSKNRKVNGHLSVDGGSQMRDSKQEYLLLGPVAFVNHCCEPNASFRRLKEDKIILIAVRKIQAGDEITVRYGSDYSSENDEDNNPCECSKCMPGNKSL